jgi:CoA:oxalate CoA-transferase
MNAATTAPVLLPGRSGSGPLQGVIVLDVTRVVAGPYCTQILADLGATVIKVEHPDDPDYTRTFGPWIGEGETRLSAFFAQFNRNKYGVTINLKEPTGKDLLKRLVAKCHVLVENFRPGTMDKLALGYDALAKENPALVYLAISGFGATGPNSRRPSFDNSGQATGGVWSMNGYPDRPPVRMGVIIGDLSAMLFGTIGLLAALREAERSGRGQFVDVSQQDSIVALTETAIIRYTVDGEIAAPLGNEHPFVRPYAQYPCKDGFVFFGGYTDKLWAESCRIFGEPELSLDPEIDTMEKRFDADTYERRIKPKLVGWFANYTKAELEALAGIHTPLCGIKTIDEVVADPHLAVRDMITEVQYPGGEIRMFGLPIKLSGTPGNPRGLAPAIGEHTELVLRSLLGVDDQAIATLRASGAI